MGRKIKSGLKVGFLWFLSKRLPVALNGGKFEAITSAAAQVGSLPKATLLGRKARDERWLYFENMRGRKKLVVSY